MQIKVMLPLWQDSLALVRYEKLVFSKYSFVQVAQDTYMLEYDWLWYTIDIKHNCPVCYHGIDQSHYNAIVYMLSNLCNSRQNFRHNFGDDTYTVKCNYTVYNGIAHKIMTITL